MKTVRMIPTGTRIHAGESPWWPRTFSSAAATPAACSSSISAWETPLGTHEYTSQRSSAGPPTRLNSIVNVLR